MAYTHAVATNQFGVAAFIVDATAASGTHTTIASALSQAVSGQTIFIKPGTYTENLTLVAGVNLCSFMCDGLNGNVTIIGKATLSTAGTVDITGIRFQTNSDFFLVASGSVAAIVNLFNCYLNCSNNTGISFTAASTSANINLFYCIGNLGTTGIGYWTSSSTGSLICQYCQLNNTGASLTATTNSAGSVNVSNCSATCVFSTSSTGAIAFIYSNIDASVINTTALTTAGNQTNNARFSYFSSGTASAISIGTGTTINAEDSIISSTNTNAITGAGTINYSGLTFSGTSYKINTTTQTGGLTQGGLTQAPTAGFIGEQIKTGATAVSISNNTYKTVASISLTAGIWDINAVADVVFSISGTAFQINISTTDNALTGTEGDAYTQSNFAAGAAAMGSIPGFRATLTGTTIYYLVVLATFGAGTCSSNGRISGTRVG